MAWQIFGTLPAGNNPLSVFDTLTAQIAKCVLVPCTAAGTNTITLTGTANAPLSAAQILAYSDLITFQFVAAATSTGTVTIAFGSLAPLNVYFSDGVTQVAAGGIVSNQPYQAIFSQPLNGGLGGFYLGQPVQKASGTEPTRQVFTSGSSATYTTPAGARQLAIRMCGGGGAGGTTSAIGVAGNTTTFGTFTAVGGGAGGAGSNAGGAGSTGGIGGSGGTGAASVRLPGGFGGAGGGGVSPAGTTTMFLPGGLGGVNYFGGGFTGTGTLTTNGTTAAGNATLHFAATVPSWVIAGLTITDTTSPSVIPPNTVVVSTTATTVVMSNNATGAGVGGTDVIVFTNNTGAGGAGASNSVNTSSNSAGGGGGAGEYAEIVINNPVATYTYTVGAAVTQSGSNAGQAGIIIVEERY